MAVTKTRRVIHKSSLSDFPTVGKVGVIYIAEDTDTTYLWDEVTQAYVSKNAVIDARITNLENKYESKELFEDISGTTTGNVTTYTNISIIQDTWAGENNAIAVEVSAGRPTQKFLFTASGDLVEAIIDTSGNYTLSGTPTATDYAICWITTGKAVDYGTANIPESKIINEFDLETPLVRNSATGDIQPINDGDNLNLLSGGLKDTNVTTAVNLGSATNTSFNTNDKTIIGSTNEILTNIESAGVVSGFAITDNLDGSIDVASGVVYLKSSDSDTAVLKYYSVNASAGISLTDNSENYVYVDYNSGTPQIAITTSGSTVRDNENDKIEIVEIFREGTTLHTTLHTQYANNVGRRIQQRLYDIQKITRTDGLILGETGTRNVTTTAGNIYVKLSKTAISAIDTSGAGTFDAYYQDGVGGWTKQADQTQWNNSNYDDGSGTLATLTNNWYTIRWFYMEGDGGLAMIYGQSQYSNSASAENDTVPATLPDRLGDHALLIGRMIIQQGDSTAKAIETSFGNIFNTTLVTDHGNLSGLSDDDHTQYALLAGRSGGQTVNGGTLTTETLILRNNATDNLGANINGDGSLSVNATNYETLVTDDDDIPNKKYVDDLVSLTDTWNEIMHNGSSFTVLNNENLSATITQNDVTNNPAALIIANTGSGNDITLPNSSYINNGALVMSTSVAANGAVLTGGTNTFDITNGSASLNIAAGSVLDVNANLTVEAASAINQDLTTDAEALFANTNLSAGGVYKIGSVRVLGIDTDREQTFAGYQSGLNTQINGNAYRNSSFGHQALYTNTEGDYNNAFGYRSLYTNAASLNSSFGAYGLWQATGDNNTGVGAYVGYNQSGGDNNVLIGAYAGNGGSSGTNAKSNNVMIGYGSGQNTLTGDGNIFLGYLCGFNETGSNKLYIENSASSSPLIYGEFDANLVKINGTFQSTGNVTIGAGAAGVDYTLTFDGEDNDGVITWLEDEDTFDMSCSLRLNGGQSVNEFSIDGTLAGDSDTAIPTEKAVKKYVDDTAGGVNYWTRAVTTISPLTANDNLDMGSGDVTTTGEVTCGDLNIKGSTPTIVFDDSNSDNFFMRTDGNDELHFSSDVSGSSSLFRFFSKDGDGTDTVGINLFGVGMSSDLTNQESLKIEYNTGYELFQIYSSNSGTGTLQNLRLGAGTYVTSNQLLLSTNGRVGMNLATPLGQLHVDQDENDGEMPTLALEQADVSEGFINFIGSDRGVITGATDSVESVRVEINGTVRRIAVYADA